MVRVLASRAVDPGFPSSLVLYILGFHRVWCCRSWVSIAIGGVMVRVLASDAVDPGFPSPSVM